MLDFVLASLIIASIVIFVITLLDKFNLIEYWQSKTTSKLLYNLLDCLFCTCFWMSFILSIFFAVWNSNGHLIFASVMSTVIVVRFVR